MVSKFTSNFWHNQFMPSHFFQWEELQESVRFYLNHFKWSRFPAFLCKLHLFSIIPEFFPHFKCFSCLFETCKCAQMPKNAVKMTFQFKQILQKYISTIRNENRSNELDELLIQNISIKHYTFYIAYNLS